MKLHEYQAKQLFQRYGIPVPKGVAYSSKEAALDAVKSMIFGSWVIKAQIHAGGRGKGGGVKIATTSDTAILAINSIFGMQLVTHQTGPKGKLVERILIEEAVSIERELYLGMVVDRTSQQIALMVSADGGMDIEKVANETPDRLFTMLIDGEKKIDMATSSELSEKIGLQQELHVGADELFQNVYRLFLECDASLVEINPLVITEDNRLIAADAKVTIDDNALFRQSEIQEFRDPSEEDINESKAAEAGLNFISLNGNIGCLVNGAGLAMATMDIIKLHGGEPANFLDVGGGANAQQVAVAFQIMLQQSTVKAVLVNIFGGIMRCDVIAKGIVEAAQETAMSLPLIIRLEGTNVIDGREILAQSGLNYISATDMDDAAIKAVHAAAG
ncbi:MAG: ADP-forming succinate--CoA ligase subunit beta [Acidiferrobacteraceae bacterium]|nr:ADP-forming succinate--CoA ligase subunit beta [Acidiferrobacteraceae bacterium]